MSSSERQKFNQALTNHIVLEEKILRKIKRLHRCLDQQKAFLTHYGSDKFKVDSRLELAKIRQSRSVSKTSSTTSLQGENSNNMQDDDLLLAVDIDKIASTNKSNSSSPVKSHAEPMKCVVEVIANSFEDLASTFNANDPRSKSIRIEIYPRNDSNNSRYESSSSQGRRTNESNCGLS